MFYRHKVVALGLVQVRQGVVEALYCLSERLSVDLVPYILLLVVPVLGRMSDQVSKDYFQKNKLYIVKICIMHMDAWPCRRRDGTSERKGRL